MKLENEHHLSQELENMAKTLCEFLMDRAMDDDAWTRAKQATSFSEMAMLCGVAQADVAVAVTMRKTEAHAVTMKLKMTT